MEEDEQVQQWEKEEERESASIQELRKKNKTMRIMECLKGQSGFKEATVRVKIRAEA
jgi:hypothetical protein